MTDAKITFFPLNLLRDLGAGDGDRIRSVATALIEKRMRNPASVIIAGVERQAFVLDGSLPTFEFITETMRLARFAIGVPRCLVSERCFNETFAAVQFRGVWVAWTLPSSPQGVA